jgi:hypothetical protein
VRGKQWWKKQFAPRVNVFWSTFFLVSSPFFGQQSVFWSAVRFLVSSPFFGQQSVFWSAVRFLVSSPFFGQMECPLWPVA